MRTKAGEFIYLGEKLLQHRKTLVTPRLLLEILNEDAETKAEKVPRSTLQYWWRQLRYQQVLKGDEKGYTIDLERLLWVMTADRVVRLSPSSEFTSRYSPATMTKLLTRARIDHAFASLTAASIYGAAVKPSVAQLFVDRTDLQRTLGLLETPGRTVVAFAENMDRLRGDHTEKVARTRVTCPFLTLLDCRAHPQGAAAARHMLRITKKRLPTP